MLISSPSLNFRPRFFAYQLLALLLGIFTLQRHQTTRLQRVHKPASNLGIRSHFSPCISLFSLLVNLSAMSRPPAWISLASGPLVIGSCASRLHLAFYPSSHLHASYTHINSRLITPRACTLPSLCLHRGSCRILGPAP